jgi:hypothetical protein
MDPNNHSSHPIVEWSGPTPCPWPSCKSKRVFNAVSTLKEHVVNIHVHPLVCTIPGCSYKKPFSRKGDLGRHQQTKHANSHPLKCPVQDCGMDFAREDKFALHLRERHPPQKCILQHCGATVAAVDLNNHHKSHGDLECALGSCGNTRTSRFNYGIGAGVSLGKHLRECHSIAENVAWALACRRRQPRIVTVERLEQLAERLGTTTAWKDCEICRDELSSSH